MMGADAFMHWGVFRNGPLFPAHLNPEPRTLGLQSVLTRLSRLADNGDLDMKPLAQQRVLVTGAAVRIGRAIALRLAAAGARIAVHFHRSEREAWELMEALARVAPGHVIVQADLGNAREREQLIPQLLDQGFPLDGLVNNASVYRRAPLLSLTPERFRDDYEINFVAPFQLMRDFAAYCKRGWIVNLLDQRVAGVDPSAGAYGLAKKSLRDVTEAAAVQWAPAIRVNAVAPGFVLPPPGVSPAKMKKFLPAIPMGCASTVDEVADACLYLAAGRTTTGQILFVDGGLHLVRAQIAERD